MFLSSWSVDAMNDIFYFGIFSFDNFIYFVDLNFMQLLENVIIDNLNRCPAKVYLNVSEACWEWKKSHRQCCSALISQRVAKPFTYRLYRISIRLKEFATNKYLVENGKVLLFVFGNKGCSIYLKRAFKYDYFVDWIVFIDLPD
jgi:hypothetical protein